MLQDEQTLRRTVAKNIAAYRKSHKDTQLDLARKLNYSDKSVSKWERGEGLPDVYILAQIAQLYGVTVSNLIGEEEPPKKANPHFHIYVLLLSVALVFVLAAILFTAFTIAAVPFPSWLFFLCAVPVSSIVCIVFTSLWWGILMQTLSITALIWSAGACICQSPFPSRTSASSLSSAPPCRCSSRSGNCSDFPGHGRGSERIFIQAWGISHANFGAL